MAKLNPDGSFSGKVGNHVYVRRHGKTYIKAYVKPADPKSQKQLAQRAMLSAASSFLAPFRQVIKTGYQGTEKWSTGYQEAVDYHIMNALINTTPQGDENPVFEIDINKVKLARGFITAPVITSFEINENEISLMWYSSLGNEFNRDYDSLSVIAYDQSKQVSAHYHVGSRKAGEGSFKLSPELEGHVHLWAFFMNKQKDEKQGMECVSDSVYLGEI